MLESTIRDLLFGLRGLRRNIGHSVIAIGSLALGIGVSTAMFTVLNAAAIRALPYRDPQQLVWISQVLKSNSTDEITLTPDFLDWRNGNRTFQSMAAYNSDTRTLTGIPEPLEVHAVKASASLLPLLGISPRLGRNFQTSEDLAGHQHVALLSDALWRSQFGGDGTVLGKPISLDGEQFTVIGVLPEGFLFPGPEQADVLTPLGKNEAGELARDGRVLTIVHNVIGRLKPGITRAQAREDLTAIQAHLPPPPFRPTITIKLLPLRDHLFGDAKITGMVLVAGSLLFLIIASTNVGSLSLVRLMQRDRELAIRRALGAGRGRVLRQLLIESFVLAALAAGLGILLTLLIRSFLVALGPYRTSIYENLPIDMRVMVFVIGVLALTLVLFGLLPALRMSDLRIGAALAGGQSSITSKRRNLRLLSVIGATEIAIVVALSSSAAVMLKSFWNMRYNELGFESKHTIASTINLGTQRYRDANREFAFLNLLLERGAAIPGVEAIALTTASEIPPGEGHATNVVRIEGRGAVNSRGEALMRPQIVSDAYFKILQIPLFEGRLLKASDGAGSTPATVVNQEFARRYFPDGSALGHRVQTGAKSDAWFTIVGVVGNAKTSGLAALPEPVVYAPYPQSDGQGLRDLGIVMRSSLPLSSLAPQFRSVVRAIDPALPVSTIETIDERLNESVSRPRFTTDLLFAFSCLGIALAMVGVYGVLTCRARAQIREIAVRQTLGAQRSDVVANVLEQAGGLVIPGLIAGLALSFAGNRLISHLLFQVKPDDPGALIAVIVCVVTASLAASFLPALRASRSDPLVSLRQN